MAGPTVDDWNAFYGEVVAPSLECRL